MASPSTSDSVGKSSPPLGVANAIERLKSLHDGDRAFSHVVRFGAEAVPYLRTLLLQREPSGLYLVRRRAVEALAALKSFETLGGFLRLDREIDDPVERLGEEVVTSTAARLIAQLREEWVFQLLLSLAKRRSLSGVLAGLGAFKRPESIPYLVRALAEDDLRPTAEAALRSFGRAARPELVQAAIHSVDPIQPQGETGLRAGRSALRVLLDIGVFRKDWPLLRPLIQDEDLQIALLACTACGRAGTAADRTIAASRLTGLRPRGDWIQRQQIDEIAIGLARREASERLKGDGDL
jgi:HEAT repeat protein